MMGRRAQTYSKSTESSDVTTLSTSSLNNEHSVPRGRSTLLDSITSVDEGVQTGIGSERELGKRDVVGDSGREMDHGDVERRVSLPRLLEDEQRVVGLETSDEHERVESVPLEGSGDFSEIDVGKGSVGSELGSTSGRPAVDSEPIELGDVVGEETVESVVDRVRGVTSGETVSDGLTGGGVHSSSGSSNTEVEREEDGWKSVSKLS